MLPSSPPLSSSSSPTSTPCPPPPPYPPIPQPRRLLCSTSTYPPVAWRVCGCTVKLHFLPDHLVKTTQQVHQKKHPQQNPQQDPTATASGAEPSPDPGPLPCHLEACADPQCHPLTDYDSFYINPGTLVRQVRGHSLSPSGSFCDLSDLLSMCWESVEDRATCYGVSESCRILQNVK